MKPITLSLAFIAAAGFAVAQDAPAVEDTDGNGTFSMEEMLAAYPTLTEEVYVEIDANADGAVDPDELATAQTDGKLPDAG